MTPNQIPTPESDANPPRYIPLKKIPPQVQISAETIRSYFDEMGMREWEFSGVADGRLVSDPERRLAVAREALTKFEGCFDSDFGLGTAENALAQTALKQ